jgi:gas vesicle protein
MGKDPGQIRTDIEETRERLGETAEAIGYKSDVKGRASGWVSDKKDAVTSRVSGAKDKVTETLPDRSEVAAHGRRGARIARENPLGLAIGGAAVGFLAGLAVPSTRVEDERLGPPADQMKEKAKEAGQEAVERGKTVAQEATQAAVETAKERGGEEGRELSSSVRESASEAAPAASRPHVPRGADPERLPR